MRCSWGNVWVAENMREMQQLQHRDMWILDDRYRDTRRPLPREANVKAENTRTDHALELNYDSEFQRHEISRNSGD